MASVETKISSELVDRNPRAPRARGIYSPENPKTAQQRNLAEATLGDGRKADAILQKIEKPINTKFDLSKLKGIESLNPEIVKNLEWNAEINLQSLLSRCDITDAKLAEQAKQIIAEQISFALQNFINHDTTVYSKISGFLHRVTGGLVGNKITGSEYQSIVGNINENINRIFSISRIQEKSGKPKAEAFQKALEVFGDGSVIQATLEKKTAYDTIRAEGLTAETGVNFVIDALTMDYGNEFVAAIEAGDRQQIETLIKKVEASVGLNIIGGKILEKGGSVFLKFLGRKSAKLVEQFQKMFPEIRELQPAYATANIESGVAAGIERKMPGNVMLSQGNAAEARVSEGWAFRLFGKRAKPAETPTQFDSRIRAIFDKTQLPKLEVGVSPRDVEAFVGREKDLIARISAEDLKQIANTEDLRVREGLIKKANGFIKERLENFTQLVEYVAKVREMDRLNPGDGLKKMKAKEMEQILSAELNKLGNSITSSDFPVSNENFIQINKMLSKL